MLRHNRAHGIGDLFSASVANRKIHVGLTQTLGLFLGVLQRSHEILWQTFGIPHPLDAPKFCRRKLRGHTLNDLEKVIQLSRLAAGEVVGRQQIQGYHLHAEVVAPAQEFANLGGACGVAILGGGCTFALGPATVAVENHSYVLRQARWLDNARK